MKGDFTRDTFHPERRYSGVRLQQGRVLLDADWNEQADIEAYRVRIASRDTIGTSGAPLHAAGFEITPQNGALQIGAGHYYVNGQLCENPQVLRIDAQTDLPGFVLPAADGAGLYLTYLDVWQRHITALEDSSIRESALNGPDTCTRQKTVWQVKLLSLGPQNSPASCADFGSDWVPPDTGSNGQLRAQTNPIPPATTPCLVPPGAGYLRLENQLYRIEIHDGSGADPVTFKWSRDNGSIVSRLAQIDGLVLTIESPPKDSTLGFSAGQWIELSDETRTLRGEPGILVQLDHAEGTTLTLRNWPNSTPLTLSDFGSLPTVRRWDSAGAVSLTPGAFSDLIDGVTGTQQDGIQLEFTAGTYRTGDYWLIPARTSTGDVEWPRDSTGALFQDRQGIHHDYAALALADFDGAHWTIHSDCRSLFPPLTELANLFYVGGDGQEALPGVALPNLLQVGVFAGEWPVANARVQFTAQANGHVATDTPGLATSTTNTIDILTGPDGIAACAWLLDPDTTNPSQSLEARLLRSDGIPIAAPIRFSGRHSIAAQVFYDPQNCGALAGQTTVQAALDRLCQLLADTKGIHVLKVLASNGDQDLTLANDKEIPMLALTNGLRIVCDGKVDARTIGQPTCYVTIETPAFGPATTTTTVPLPPPFVGYQPLRPDAVQRVAADPAIGSPSVPEGPVIVWTPTKAGDFFLQQELPALLIKAQLKRALARLTLKGSFIRGADGKLLLDGETSLLHPERSGDGRPGGDFEMWFWLVPSGAMSSLTLAPNPVSGGRVVTGTLTMSQPVAADTIVTLSSNSPAAAVIPANVTIPNGKDQATFTLRTTPNQLPTPTVVTITAQLNDQSLTSQLTIQQG